MEKITDDPGRSGMSKKKGVLTGRVPTGGRTQTARRLASLSRLWIQATVFCFVGATPTLAHRLLLPPGGGSNEGFAYYAANLSYLAGAMILVFTMILAAFAHSTVEQGGGPEGEERKGALPVAAGSLLLVGVLLDLIYLLVVTLGAALG